jgi:hypothetical protein
MNCILTSVAFILLAVAPQAKPSIDLALAEQYFNEAETSCRDDGGKLWGRSLCGPMLFADARTRMVVANQKDAEGILTKQGNVYLGRLPDKETVANTAYRWSGVYWTMVMWPLPANKTARLRLMTHELYHRIQPDIGLPASNPSNAHLDSVEGRILLQLEWRALRRALTGKEVDRRTAIEDGLVFRQRRREVFPEAAITERGLEMNEGLAEYTGVKLRGTTLAESLAFIARKLEESESLPSFVRSFAYASGPAYGFLLDESGKEWRKGLKPENDFGVMIERAFSITLPPDFKLGIEKRAARYDGDKLREAENERDAQRQRRIAEYRKRFVDGPVLLLPLTPQMNYSFDPNNVQTLDASSSVYPTLKVSDAWGILSVSNGALMTRDGSKISSVTVPAPSDASQLKGDGWVLELSEGWRLMPGARKGDYTVKPVR